jgi:O-acetylserine/cysteine efflux transporter
MPQFLLAALRYSFAAFPLLLFIKPPKTDWKIVAGFGLSQGFMSFFLVFQGLILGVPVGLVSLIYQMQVVFSVLLSWLILKNKPTKYQTAGLGLACLGMIGVALTINHEHVPILGMLCIMVAAFFWSIGNILAKIAGPINSVSLVVWSSVSAALMNIIMTLWFEGPTLIVSSLMDATWVGYGCLAYIVGLATISGSSIQAYLIKLYNPTVVIPYSLLIPVVGMLGGWLILDETLSFETFLACLVVFAGLVLNQWKARVADPVAVTVEDEDSSVEFKKIA